MSTETGEVHYYFSGEFSIYDTSCCLAASNNVDGTITLDWASGLGTASIWNKGTPGFNGDVDIMGIPWTAHDITLQVTGADVVHVDFMFDWNGNNNIHAVFNWLMTPMGLGEFSVTSLDGDNNGYPGISMDNGPFAGWDASIAGTASVPIPATVWLLGSGLLGLVGVARKRKVA